MAKLGFSAPRSNPKTDRNCSARPNSRTGDRQSLPDIAAKRTLPLAPHKQQKSNAERAEAPPPRTLSGALWKSPKKVEFRTEFRSIRAAEVQTYVGSRRLSKAYTLSQRGRPLPDSRSRPDQDFVALLHHPRHYLQR
jgi:hypothetical protein